ncbi:MAG: hypothetical protein LBB90_00985, partial [Tannerella sp.]|nr:hypothetical protein [Tannerella sp.]
DVNERGSDVNERKGDVNGRTKIHCSGKYFFAVNGYFTEKLQLFALFLFHITGIIVSDRKKAPGKNFETVKIIALRNMSA